MIRSEDRLRIVIAVTESCSLNELWRSARDAMRGMRAEVTAVFLHDERWHRAASLPFTREISRVGGNVDFTRQRAERILAETVSGLRKEMEQLAAEADIPIAFHVLPESDRGRARALIRSGKNVLIAPAFLAEHPIYAELAQLDVRIELVDGNRT